MSDHQDQYIHFLREAGCGENVIAHCQAVRDLALAITDRIRKAGIIQVNRDLVATGAILHDIGRSQTHGMDHADVGAVLCRDLHFDDSVCDIVARHIGAGMTAGERSSYGLIPEDRIPITAEEKIVAHADNLIKGTTVISVDEMFRSIQKFPPEVQQRFRDLSGWIEMNSAP